MGEFMNERSLYYASILYSESAPDNWMQILEDTHIACLISPLHDMDLDKDGNYKKAHRHILFIFETLKSRRQMQTIIDKIGAVGCESVISPKAYALYLTHENAPDKAQYNPEDILALSGGYDFLERAHNSTISRYDVITDIIRFCQSENIDCFADIVEYALDNNQEWFHVLSEGSSSIMLTNYLKSRTWRNSKNK